MPLTCTGPEFRAGIALAEEVVAEAAVAEDTAKPQLVIAIQGAMEAR
jgi:hypothetical protein